MVTRFNALTVSPTSFLAPNGLEIVLARKGYKRLPYYTREGFRYYIYKLHKGMVYSICSITDKPVSISFHLLNEDEQKQVMNVLIEFSDFGDN